MRNESSNISLDPTALDIHSNSHHDLKGGDDPNGHLPQPLSSKTYYVRDPSKYRSLADRIERVLHRQQKEGKLSTRFLQNRNKISSLRNDPNVRRQSRLKLSLSMRQCGSSISGSKLLSDSFLSEIVPLKGNFQNAVKNDEFAQQLTIMIFKAFQRVQKREFMDQAWKCRDRLELAGNLCQLIDHFNDLSRWVQITILQCDGVKKRGRMIKKFIKIMDCLLKYNNLQSLCAVYGALSSPVITSLESAWKYVASKHKDRYQQIKGYFSTADNMANLRNLHRAKRAPMVPYTGIYLQVLSPSSFNLSFCRSVNDCY